MPTTPTHPPPRPLEAIDAAARALEESRQQLASTFTRAADGRRRGSRWRTLLTPLAARRPWLLVGGAALVGGLAGLFMGSAPRRAVQRGFALLVGPALWGAVRAESQRLVQQLIHHHLFKSAAPAPRRDPGPMA